MAKRPVIVSSESETVSAEELLKHLFGAEERTYHVSFQLPTPVLIAVLDKDHEMADVERAVKFGLLDEHGLTAIGMLVYNGFDRIAVGHKMAAEWRLNHNGSVDRDKRSVFKNS